MNILKNARRIFSSSPGAGSASVLGYKEYTVLLTQDATDAPTINELNNTLGFTPIASYIGDGSYRLTYASGFPISKTVIITKQISSVDHQIRIGIHGSGNYIAIQTSVVNSNVGTGAIEETPTNSILANTPLIIRVYP